MCLVYCRGAFGLFRSWSAGRLVQTYALTFVVMEPTATMLMVKVWRFLLLRPPAESG
jgi:hypothetical protein